LPRGVAPAIRIRPFRRRVSRSFQSSERHAGKGAQSLRAALERRARSQGGAALGRARIQFALAWGERAVHLRCPGEGARSFCAALGRARSKPHSFAEGLLGKPSQGRGGRVERASRQRRTQSEEFLSPGRSQRECAGTSAPTRSLAQTRTRTPAHTHTHTHTHTHARARGPAEEGHPTPTRSSLPALEAATSRGGNGSGRSVGETQTRAGGLPGIRVGVNPRNSKDPAGHPPCWTEET